MSAIAEHSFVVPAYGFSPFLRSCLDSLKGQSFPSEIVVATSTPTAELRQLCAELDIRLHEHGPNRGIAADWNAALDQASSAYVTVAHQDDIYYPGFAERTVHALRAARRPLLVFTDYEELTETGPRPPNRLLLIKRVLLELGFLGRSRISSRLSKRNVLRFACPIPCPAVTLNRNVYQSGFDTTYQINLDWATWLDAANAEGEFLWVRESLMGHRIHTTSETSAAITDGRRMSEDLRILCGLWPSIIARAIGRNYEIAYRSNERDDMA